MTLGMNDSQPCPSASHRRTALAHGRICFVCEPDERWMARCPKCLLDVPAKGLFVLPHVTPGRWVNAAAQKCPGSGSRINQPAVEPLPLRRGAA